MNAKPRRKSYVSTIGWWAFGALFTAVSLFPEENPDWTTGTMVVGFVTASVCFLIGAALFVKNRHKNLSADFDGDGIGNDLRSATNEQLKMIEAKFQELGVFYQAARKRPTQAEARQTIKDLDAQLAARQPKKS